MDIRTLRRLNWEVAVKILVLLAYAVFFLSVVVSGRASLYVHPRVLPYMIAAGAVMILTALAMAGTLFKPRLRTRFPFYLTAFILPLAAAVILPAQSFQSGGSAGTLSVTALSGIDGGISSSQPSQQPDAASQSAAVRDTDPPLTDGAIMMDSDHFDQWLTALYTQPDRYADTPIEVVGFVYKDEELFGPEEFVPARMVMVCCAADMQISGLLCRFEGASSLAVDSWVLVRGVVGDTEFQGERIPIIEAQSVQPCDKPEPDYVYPFFG
jgi:putative membrane protein